MESYKNRDVWNNIIREIIQNSLDAVISNSKPVHVKIGTFKISPSKIGAFDLIDHINVLLKDAKKRNNDDAKKICQTALKTLESDIQVFFVIDSNTTGLREKNLNALVYEEGNSEKSGNSGGSYGIGKHAPFIASAIRTVFYSTKYNDSKIRERFIGKAILASHEHPRNGVMLQNIGLCTNKPVKRGLEASTINGNDIDDCFRLEDVGTGVFIVGFDPPTKRWRNGTIQAIVRNFFAAIHHEKLTIEINDDIINKDSLPPHLKSLGEKDRTHFYYEALKDPAGREIIEENDMKFILNYVKDDENLPNTIAYINRKGMIITDTRQSGTNPFRVKLGEYLKYTAIVQAEDDKTDEHIRKMEPPSHDSISLTRIQSEEEREEKATVLKSIAKKMEEILEHAVSSSMQGDTIKADEIMEFFPIEASSGVLKVIKRDMPEQPGTAAITDNTKPRSSGKTRPQKLPRPRGPPREPRQPRGPKSHLARRRFTRSGDRLRLFFDNSSEKDIEFSIRQAGEEDTKYKYISILSANILLPNNLVGDILKDGSVIIPPCHDRMAIEFGIPLETPYTGYEIIEKIIEDDSQVDANPEVDEHDA